MATATEDRVATPDEVDAHKGTEEEADEVIQLSIEGDGDLTLAVGGKNADEATLNFAGGEIKLGKGQFKKGQRVAVLLVGPIAEIHMKDIRDPKTGDVAKTKRKHVMKPDTVKRVPMEQAERD